MLFDSFGININYSCNPEREFPATGIPPPILFSTSTCTQSGSGMPVSIEHQSGTSWWGIFGWGGMEFSKVCACPNIDYVCVVSEGQGYIVNTADPTIFEVMRLYPIKNIRYDYKYNVLLFYSDNYACAYDANGLIWYKYLCSDDLRILEVNDRTIVFTGWEAGEDIKFKLDLLKGELIYE